MTERYGMSNETGAFTDKKFNKEYTDDEIIDLLNQLNDENIELHIQNDFLKDENQHMRDLVNENEQLKASLYAEKTNTAEVVNDYSKQFKRHSAQFSFMMDLADDLGVDVTTLEALDD